SVLRAVRREDVGEGRRENCAESVVEQRPRRMFARGAAAKIAAGDENRGIAVARRVERKIAAGAPVVKEKFAEAGALDALEKLLRNDLIGVDVIALERHDDPALDSKDSHDR